MITISGLASGLDTNTIVTALMDAAQIPLAGVQQEEQDATTAQSDMSSFMSTLSSLQSASEARSTPSGFSSLTASSTAPGVSASITGTTAPGAFSVSVTQLATEQRTQLNSEYAQLEVTMSNTKLESEQIAAMTGSSSSSSSSSFSSGSAGFLDTGSSSSTG